MDEKPNLLTPNYSQPANLPNATASLVLGIIAIVISFCYGIGGVICGIIGLVLANKDRRLYQANPELYSSSSYSTSSSGRICSIVGLVLGAVVILVIMFYFLIFGSLIMEAIRHAPRQ